MEHDDVKTYTTLDEMLAEMDRDKTVRQRIVRAARRLRHRLGNLRYAHLKAVYAYQRVTRGWSDQDTWSFDHYLSEVIAGGVERLKRDAHGYPASLLCDVCTAPGPYVKHECTGAQSWADTLQAIADGFRSAHAPEPEYRDGAYVWESAEERSVREEKFAKGILLFHTYYGSLWD